MPNFALGEQLIKADKIIDGYEVSARWLLSDGQFKLTDPALWDELTKAEEQLRKLPDAFARIIGRYSLYKRWHILARTYVSKDYLLNYLTYSTRSKAQ